MSRARLLLRFTVALVTGAAVMGSAMTTGCSFTLDFGDAATGLDDAAPVVDAPGADVESPLDSTTPPAPECGNGIVERGEACDLGRERNGTTDVGCTSDCRVVCCADERSFQRTSADSGPAEAAHCYYRINLSGTEPWTYMRRRCKARGGDYAAITSEEELAFAASFIVTKSFIGGYRDHNGAFQWVTGEPWFDAWAPGAFPPPATADRVQMIVDGFQGVSESGVSLYAGVCERAPDVAPLCPDAQ